MSSILGLVPLNKISFYFHSLTLLAVTYNHSSWVLLWST